MYCVEAVNSTETLVNQGNILVVSAVVITDNKYN